MAGGGGGAVGMRLNIMTALYLPILGYAMSTFNLNPNALVISSDNLQAEAVPVQRLLAVGEQFSAKIMYELVPTPAQKARMEAIARGEAVEGEEKDKVVFTPVVEVMESSSPIGMRFDEIEKRIVFDTKDVFKGEKPEVITKNVKYKAKIIGKSAKGEGFERIFEDEFTVFRPTIQVQSNAKPRLMRECRNSLLITVPGVAASDIEIEDRSTKTRVKGNTITWSPKGENTLLSVYRRTPTGMQLVGTTEEYNITPPPPPTVGFRKKGERNFLTRTDVVRLSDPYEIVIKPEDTFSKEFPDDAKYRIESVEFRLNKRGLAPEEATMNRDAVEKARRKTSNAFGEIIYDLDFIDVFGGLPRGIGIDIFVNGVSRINYENRSIKLDDASPMLSFASN